MRSLEAVGLAALVLACASCGPPWAEEHSANARPSGDSAQAADENQVGSAGRQEVLGGRFVVDAPPDAVLKAPGGDIMSAAASLHIEDNLWVERDDFRFVMTSEELFVRCDGDFSRTAPKIAEWIYGTPEEGSYKLEPGPTDGVSSIGLVLEPPSRTQDTTYLGTQLVCHQGTLVRMIFATNLSPTDDLTLATSLRRQLIDSLAAGPRPLNLGPRTETLAPSDELTFSLDVPAGMIFYSELGPDFVVYRVKNVTPMGAPPSSALFYFGHHPSASEGNRTVSDRVLGKSMEWSADENDPPTLSYLTDVSDGLFMHIILEAGQEAQLNQLKKMTGSLQQIAR